MGAEQITSRSNRLLTHIRKIAASRSYRRETGEFLGDGTKLLQEALLWGAELHAVVRTPDTVIPELPAGVREVEVPGDIMRSISPMETPQGVLFLAALRSEKLPEQLDGRRYLVLEGVQDPGNVGTMLRTADAFDADGMICLEGCADLYNPKTVRATMGAIFRRKVWCCGLQELQETLERSNLPLYGAALREDTADVREIDLRRGAVLIGSEGRGLSEGALSACTKTVKIPMSGRCESLNAAVAAATLLWEGWR